MTDTVRDALIRAKEVLRQHGWSQYHFMDPKTGAVCLYEALLRAFGTSIFGTVAVPCEKKPVFRETYRTLADRLGTTSCSDWNGRDGRTEEEVHLMLQGLIDDLAAVEHGSRGEAVGRGDLQ